MTYESITIQKDGQTYHTTVTKTGEGYTHECKLEGASKVIRWWVSEDEFLNGGARELFDLNYRYLLVLQNTIELDKVLSEC